MIITSRRSNTPSLNNSIHHRLLNSPILKRTTRIPTTSKIQIRHTKPSNNQITKQRQPKGTQSSIQPNAQHGPKVPNRAPKATSAKASSRSNHQPKFPMVVRKAKGRHLFTFERLCHAAGVRKQTGAGPSPPGHVPPINCSSLRSNRRHQPHSRSSQHSTPGKRTRHARR